MVAAAGALGAVARYTLDYWLVSGGTRHIPLGTFTVNVTGSLALGFVVGLASAQGLPQDYAMVIGAGFLGAYTTFSTWMYEAVRLVQRGAWRTATFHVLGSVVAGVVAAGAGLWLAHMM